jgi:hypothetical protein
MEPVEIDTKDNNVACALLGRKWGERCVPSKTLGWMLNIFLWLGGTIGVLPLFRILPSYWAIIGSLMVLLGLLF